MSAFIRLRKVSDRKRVVLNVDLIEYIEETDEGSTVSVASGSEFKVEETERAIRGLIAKSGETDSE